MVVIVVVASGGWCLVLKVCDHATGRFRKDLIGIFKDVGLNIIVTPIQSPSCTLFQTQTHACFMYYQYKIKASGNCISSQRFQTPYGYKQYIRINRIISHLFSILYMINRAGDLRNCLHEQLHAGHQNELDLLKIIRCESHLVQLGRLHKDKQVFYPNPQAYLNNRHF